MPIGIFTNVLAVFFGGILGTILGRRLTPKFIEKMNLIFATCAMGMGITSIANIRNMPAVILALVLGGAIGILLHLEQGIHRFGELLQKPVARFAGKTDSMSEEDFSSLMITAMVLFCASGMGIYGCLDASMTGDNTILLSKSILDIFTAMIFACNLGAVTSMIAIPQAVVFSVLFCLAQIILPLTNEVMIGDFRACGGFFLLATGLRLARVKEFPIADMIPAMFLVMPFSALWLAYVIPLL